MKIFKIFATQKEQLLLKIVIFYKIVLVFGLTYIFSGFFSKNLEFLKYFQGMLTDCAFSRKIPRLINEKSLVQDPRDEARMRGSAALKSLK